MICLAQSSIVRMIPWNEQRESKGMNRDIAEPRDGTAINDRIVC